MKDNAAYTGEWSVKRIANPAYKGVWEAKKVDNPEFVDDETVGTYADFGYIGLDLWQVRGGAVFDNFIITDDKHEANKMKEKWRKMYEIETAAEVKYEKQNKRDMARHQAMQNDPSIMRQQQMEMQRNKERMQEAQREKRSEDL